MRIERGLLAVAVGLGALTVLRRAGSLAEGGVSLYVPVGLLSLSLANVFLRAKGLAWGIFTLALVLLFIIAGTWAVVDRAMRGPPSSDFLRSIALYGCLAAVGFLQLRVRPPSKGGPAS